MARPCACKGNKTAKAAATKVTVQLAGGTKIQKNSPEAAAAFVASHPGAKVV